MAFGALIMLVAVALVVAAVLALLRDQRFRPWGALLVIVLAVAAGVLLLAALGHPIRIITPGAAWQTDGAQQPPPPLQTAVDVSLVPVAMMLIAWIALAAILFSVFVKDKTWFRRHLGNAGGWVLVALGVLFVALLAPPRKWFDNPPTTSATTTYRNLAETTLQRTHSSTIEKAPTETTTSAATSSTENSDNSRPDWVNQPPSKQGDSYMVAVASGRYADPGMRDQMLDAKMVAAANRYIDEVVYHQPGLSDALALDADYLQNFVREHGTSSAKDETFVQLEFNKRFRDEIDYRYRQFISLGRLEQLSGGALGALALLGGLYCYLRLTQPRRASAAKPADVSV